MRKGTDMINGIGSSGNGRVDLNRTDSARRNVATPSTQPAGAAPATASERASSTGAGIASLGAPIDAEKIAAIRAAIAEGRYPVNPQAIAEKMIALDLPLKF